MRALDMDEGLPPDLQPGECGAAMPPVIHKEAALFEWLQCSDGSGCGRSPAMPLHPFATLRFPFIRILCSTLCSPRGSAAAQSPDPGPQDASVGVGGAAAADADGGPQPTDLQGAPIVFSRARVFIH